MGKKTHLHDYRATWISIKIPLCVFMGVGTARGTKEPRSAVYALHPSIFPRALCHHVRGSPSESPLLGSNKHKGRSRAPALTLPAAGQQRLRSERKTALEKKKRKKTVGKKHKGASALSHWILNLGLSDTQVGTDCSREQLVEESLRGKCERISCWGGGNWQLPTFPSTLSGHFIRNTLLAPTKWLLNLAQVWMCPDMLFSRTWGVPGVILLSSFDIVALHFCLCNSNEPFVLIVPYLHPKICHFKK